VVATLIVSEQKPARPNGNLVAPIRVSEVISSLSFALDLTEGQPVGHSIRSCVFGMHIAKEIGLPVDVQGDLYYALLMKDAGCSTNASKMFQILGTDDIQAKRDVKTTDWTRVGWESLEYALSHVRTGAPFLERVRALFDLAIHHKKNSQEMVQIRCERGAAIARRIGLSEATASAIHSLDELWNGSGHPAGLRGKEIPLLARILNLAQTVDVFYTSYDAKAAVKVAEERSGRWFDPDLVRAFCSAAKKESLWTDVDNAATKVLELEPRHDVLASDEATLDNICLAFADVIDAKSPFTYRHSTGVAGAAVAIARTMSLTEPEVTLIRRAALLHDIGKLSVSNAILDKPDKLTEAEWEVVRKHPAYSHQILRRIPNFQDLSEIAASHHEKLNGTGYFRGMAADQLSLPARILVVSDIYDALAAKRPYRDALALETVLEIMQRDAPQALDGACFEALKGSVGAANTIASDLYHLSLNFQQSASMSNPPIIANHQ
jgi:putative nucleotidyltransferase with HDIG domain